ncbi:hypothetical protein NLM33_30755 [Bradyrhizobium sp. CCGUVB1N3]|uniref:hypothetical protein n=1 Tax=Bradyrhizobium sp. CCGUVB1N3 TaxID=2949629 RepID=UPI0020B2C1AD|nr:hypothetical protein [Bradyrhizobium sp. CCGUVB1N3]MCP3474701.1 hypothetical protein [Bradyrhizobium sp. CCGUVB1N3]
MKTAIVIVGALGLAMALPDASVAATSIAMQQQPSARTADFGAPRHDRYAHRVRHVPYQPHYYARPVYYRPYPYRVPAPFVLGFGPWW